MPLSLARLIPCLAVLSRHGLAKDRDEIVGANLGSEAKSPALRRAAQNGTLWSDNSGRSLQGVRSCEGYGCVGYTPSHSCQCNDKCAQFDSCCEDYTIVCSGGVSSTCASFGCGDYVASRPCQCNELCRQFGNCCEDYDTACAGQPFVPVPPDNAALPLGHPDPSKQYPQHDGFSLWLVEEFDEPIDVESDPIWTWSDGGLSEGSVRFVKEGLVFADGKLKIFARNDLGVGVDRCSHAESTVVPDKPLTSGELRTKFNLFRYGRYEVSMKAPSVQPGNANVNGNYIATMFVFRDAKFRHWREIDIEATGDSPQSVTTNVLHADYTSFWSPSIARAVEVAAPFNTRQGFHTYAFEWLPDRVTWYIDGKAVRTHSENDGIPIPDRSGKIMMNLWIFAGSGFGGPEGYNNRFPMHVEYDWFRFYKWDGEQQYPCDGASSSCLTEDDLFLTSNNPCDGIQQMGRDGVCTASCRR